MPSVEEATLTSLDPLLVVGGGRLWLRGSGFPLPASPRDECTIGGEPAHVVFAAPDRVALEVPLGLEGGATEVKAPWLPGATPFVHVGVLVATGFHQVDSPAIDSEGRVYVTYSGSRGQQSPVSVFRVVPGGPREPFVTGIVNATSMTFGPDARLYVSSRFDGTVYRVFDDGHHEVVASDLGLACGVLLAFGAPAAAQSTTIVADTFTDSNGTALTAHHPDTNQLGRPWTVPSGTAPTISNLNGIRLNDVEWRGRERIGHEHQHGAGHRDGNRDSADHGDTRSRSREHVERDREPWLHDRVRQFQRRERNGTDVAHA